METTAWQIFAQFGLAGIIFGGFLLVLNWVFGVNHKILDNMEKERMSYQTILDGFNENLRENRAFNQTYHKQMEEQHKAQHEEHKEMIVILGRINGYKEH